MKQMRYRGWLYPLLAGLIIGIGCYLAGWLFMPVRKDYGSTWEQYLQEEQESIDILVFGSSVAYCDVIPAIFWEETGATCYVMAGPEQTIPLTYFYIKEAMKTQSPKVIFLELTGMFYNQYGDFTKVNVGYMPWSDNRLAATFLAAEPEERIGLLFPLYIYHSRWMQISLKEIKDHLQPQRDIFAGYTYLEETADRPLPLQERPFSAQTDTYQKNLEYLGKIEKYCKEKDCKIVAYVAPAKSQIPEEALKTLAWDVGKLQNIIFLNCYPEQNAMGIEDSQDWYDSLHFNVYGAEKFTRFLAQYAKEQQLIPKVSQSKDTRLWEERLDWIHGCLQTRKNESRSTKDGPV